MNWLILLLPWLAFNLLAYLLAPILPVFARNLDGMCDNNQRMGVEPRLPPWLSWFMTPDNSLLGDGTFAKEHDGGYWSQVQWLWRNPAYGFELQVLAAKIRPEDCIAVEGDLAIRDGEGGVAGRCYVTVGDYWGLLIIRPIPFSRCLHWEFGWKLKTYAEDPSRLVTQPRAQFVCSPRFSRFNGGV